MVVQCTPVRLLFSNINNGYKVWSCQASNAPDDFEFQQNSKKFTVAGDNLDFLEFGQKCTIDVELNKNVKYKASYELVGIPGIDCTMEGIEVDPAQELEILNGITTRALAKNTHEAYPNFVQLILSGREKEIDTNKIKGVGPKYFEVFQTKIKKSCRSIMFGAIGKKYGLSAIDCKALVTKYKSPIELEQAINSEPYRVFIDECGKSFKASDKTILSHFPDLIKSSQRCLYACVAMLKYNESEGSTKIAAKDLFAAVSTAYPMLADKIFEQVTTSDKIHYDEVTKYCAMKSTYLAECNIAEHINYRLAHSDEIHCEDVEQFAEIDGNRLTDEQCEIMRLIQHNNVMMLTGNAGSGKTSSTRALLSMLDNCGVTYTLLAPTGTAAKQIMRATGREASTIHMFLATEGIAGDVALLDEFSMVSTELFSTLLTAIGLDKKLVLICDPAQLPSISCGNLATDLINSGKIPIANLTRIFRYNSSGLITVATDVRNGSNESLTKKFPDYELIEPNNDIQGEDIMSCILRTYHQLVGEYGKHDVLVLSPYNVGSTGTFEINQKIQGLVQKNPATNLKREVTVGREKKEICFRCNDMVINKKNNYHMLDVDTEEEVFIANGAIGEIIKVGDNCMTVNYDGRHIFVEEDQIRHTMLGYAISIHSSQGSQAKAVIVVMDSSHARMLNRNLEYVAMTRSIEKLVVIGDIRAVEHGLNIEATNNRKTFLKEMLK